MPRPWQRSTSIALVNVFAATLHGESFWARIVTVEIAGGSTTAPRFDRLIAHSVRYSGTAHAAVKASLSPFADHHGLPRQRVLQRLTAGASPQSNAVAAKGAERHFGILQGRLTESAVRPFAEPCPMHRDDRAVGTADSGEQCRPRASASAVP